MQQPSIKNQQGPYVRGNQWWSVVFPSPMNNDPSVLSLLLAWTSCKPKSPFGRDLRCYDARVTWWQWKEPTLVKKSEAILKNQCWLISSEVQMPSHESNLSGRTWYFNQRRNFRLRVTLFAVVNIQPLKWFQVTMSITRIRGTYNIGTCFSWISFKTSPSNIDSRPVI